LWLKYIASVRTAFKTKSVFDKALDNKLRWVYLKKYINTFVLYDKYGGRPKQVHIGKLKVITSQSPLKAS